MLAVLPATQANLHAPAAVPADVGAGPVRLLLLLLLLGRRLLLLLLLLQISVFTASHRLPL
jgi:hypothetical protein